MIEAVLYMVTGALILGIGLVLYDAWIKSHEDDDDRRHHRRPRHRCIDRE
jgi:hypothetical protein